MTKEQHPQIDIEQLKHDLKNGAVEVRFIKVDGSERVMNCSLNEAYLPPKKDIYEGVARERKPVEGLLVVYEVATGWRSFKEDSVTEYKVLSVVS